MIFTLFSIDKLSTDSRIWYIVKVRLSTDNIFVETKIVLTLFLKSAFNHLTR